MSDSFACDHWESSVDESKSNRENWEDDIGDIDAENKARTDAVLCNSRKFECAGAGSDYGRKEASTTTAPCGPKKLHLGNPWHSTHLNRFSMIMEMSCEDLILEKT